MGWGLGYDEKWKRFIGYGVPAYCDHPGCGEEIDRGLSHVCGYSEPYGGEEGCGLYFCYEHGAESLCERCRGKKPPFDPKPEHPDWLKHQAEDPSWEEWRQEQAKK